MFLKQVSSPSLYLFNQKYIKEYIVKYCYTYNNFLYRQFNRRYFN